MKPTDELLSSLETCERAAYWNLRWERNKITPTQLLHSGIREGLLTERKDFGECAGESIMGLAAEKEILSEQQNIYAEVIHSASLADIISCAVRKPSEGPWVIPEVATIPGGLQWSSSVFLAPSGGYLRRVVLVSSWGKDKHYSFCRSWETIGNICAYSLPMQVAIVVLGQYREGKRYGPLSRGLRHPANKVLRFRKRHDVGSGFKNTWNQVWREDFDEISTAEWLAAMHNDGVLSDVCFSVTVEVPEATAKAHVLDLASRKLEKLYKIESVPDEQFTGCSWPVKCAFISPCHSGQEPNGRFGFVKLK